MHYNLRKHFLVIEIFKCGIIYKHCRFCHRGLNGLGFRYPHWIGLLTGSPVVGVVGRAVYERLWLWVGTTGGNFEIRNVL